MSDSIRAQHYASVVHPFIAIFIPFWFMLTVVVVMVQSALLQSGIVIFPPFYIVLLLLVGASETVTGNLLYKERIAGIVPRLREFVFIIIIGLFLILLLHGDVARGDFNIGRIKIWLPMLVLAVEWFMSYYIHQKLRERELFLRFFTDKSERDTRATYDAYMHEGGESLKAIVSVKRFTMVLLVIGFLVLNVMSWGFRFNFRGMNLFIIVVFFGGYMLIASVLNTWSETQFVMMDGLLVSRSQRRFRAFVIFLLFALLLVLAIPATGSRPLLPESYIATFFAWLQKIGSFEPPDTEVEPPDVSFGTPDYDTGDYLGRATNMLGDESDALANIVRVIGWALLVVLIMGAVAFLLLPFFRKGGDGFKGVVRAIRQVVANMQNAFGRLGESIRKLREELENRRKSRGWKRIRDRGTQGRLAERLERAAAKMGLTRHERKVNNKILRAFFRLTRWGEKRGVAFQTTMGAWEYAMKLEAAIPDQGSECIAVAQLFEEAMFSGRQIEESLLSTFNDRIKEIMKTK